jgi:two-component system sensor histidine kinase KdpD
VARDVSDVARVVAALSRATGTALDPASILARAVGALEAALDVGRVDLWRSTPSGLDLAASHPPRPPGTAPDLEADIATAGTHILPLDSRGQVLGRLVVHPGSRGSFDADDEALLEIAANQIAGALERVQLFNEVMALERLKSDFVARVSHELRTPITIINGFLETLIAHDATLDAEQRLHMLERSRTASSRLGQLIEELLLLSRIEGGVLTPEPRQLAISEVYDAVRAAAVESDQVLVTGPLDQVIVTDPALLTRALGLVVDNAIKYGGVAELSAHKTSGRWHLEVRDRGPGFADDIRSTAFEMFARSQSTTAVPGLGMGLAIARTLVEVLDGTIGFEDAVPGPGAVVRITLPA